MGSPSIWSVSAGAVRTAPRAGEVLRIGPRECEEIQITVSGCETVVYTTISSATSPEEIRSIKGRQG